MVVDELVAVGVAVWFVGLWPSAGMVFHAVLSIHIEPYPDESNPFKGYRPATVFVMVLAWPVTLAGWLVYRSPTVVRWLFTPQR